MISVAVIYGGNSPEYEISRKSGEFVAASLDRTRYDVYEIFLRGTSWKLVRCDRASLPEDGIEICKDDFSVVVDGIKTLFDYAFIMIHGTPGENGLIQGYLEMMGVPSSGCSSFVSAVTFDKYSAKRYLSESGICKMAEHIFLHKGQRCSAQQAIDRLGLPLFVKPTDNGSSFGVTKVKTAEDFGKALDYAFSEGNTVLVEKALTGMEIDDAVYFDGSRVVALPPIEIVPKREYFDYQAKYDGLSEEICPARISKEVSRKIMECSERIYEFFGCSGMVRVDYFLSEDDDLYFMEMNTVPGMTAASLVPKEVRAAGMEIGNFLTQIIETTFGGGRRKL